MLPIGPGFNMKSARAQVVTKPKILIDCDPGHDDTVAILFAARHLEQRHVEPGQLKDGQGIAGRVLYCVVAVYGRDADERPSAAPTH